MTLVALSGGADSVALLRLLHQQGADIVALHCNFHLRGEESERDEHFVTDLCQQLDIPIYIKHFDTNAYAAEHHISTEMAARELRYEWFEDMRRQLGAQDIAVAHHRDDQAETVLLNLIRGTGLRGLAGMQRNSGHISRPLLHMSRQEILDYLARIGQNYVTDSTNLERDALRNRIRLDVMPILQQLNPQAAAHIAQTASLVAEALPYYHRGVDSSTRLSPTTLHERLYGMGFTPAQEQQMWQSQRAGATFESSTHRATFTRGKLMVEEKAMHLPAPTLSTDVISVADPLDWVKRTTLSPGTCAIDAQSVSEGLTLRMTQAGDRFRPLGMKRGTRLVSDFLAEQGLSVFERQRQWLVCHGGDIVWVVGHRIDERFRITDQTKEIMEIRLIYRKTN